MYQYRLDWQEGHGLKTDLDSLVFDAPDDTSALLRVAGASGAKLEEGQLTEQSFHQAGGAAVYQGQRKVFPR